MWLLTTGATSATAHSPTRQAALQPSSTFLEEGVPLGVCNQSVWTFGIAIRCCNIAPFDGVPVDSSEVGAHGDLMWPNRPGTVDYESVDLPNGSIVYVPASHTSLRRFVSRFLTLPTSFRVTLVTGFADWSLPREIFEETPPRDTVMELSGWHGITQINLTSFLSDTRLLHWWTQNYDLTGCNPWGGCSPVDPQSPMARKVSPIPIGLDFYRPAFEPEEGVDGTPGASMSVCQQQHNLDASAAAASPWSERPMGLLAPFDCGADVALRLQLLQPDRQAACTALKATTGLDLLRWFEGDRAKYWKALGETSFVAAPQGRGLDTYRLWEVLSMGSVPVVTSSSLDLLFSSFPVIIVPSWDEVTNALTNPTRLREWKTTIQRRFGSEPFASAEVQRMLQLDYWVAQIQTTHTDLGGIDLS